MWRLDVNLNVIVLCLMEGIFTKCDGYHIQRTFLVALRGAGVIFNRGGGAGEGVQGLFSNRGGGRYQLQGLHGTSMHTQMGCLGFFGGVCMQKNGSGSVCRRMGVEIGRDQLPRTGAA